TVDINIGTETLGIGKDGEPVYMNDIWPSLNEITEEVEKVVTPEIFRKEYESVFDSNEKWNEINTTDKPLFEWNDKSTYIQNPPFFEDLTKDAGHIEPINDLRAIGLFGDSVTTDHISPAGAIAKDMPAGRYLQEHDVSPRNFNSYGSRRGNHEVMMRGTFANIRIRNLLAPGTEGGYTTYWPTNAVMPIYDAAMKYKEDNTDLVVIGGAACGMGSMLDRSARGSVIL